MQAYCPPSLYDALGIYIPLIVVNCIILGRAEAYASKNPVLPSMFDGLGMGLGFTVGLTVLGAFRELIGAGTVFGLHIMPASYEPMIIFILPPGAFFVLAALVAIQNKFKNKKKKEYSDIEICKDGGCASCTNMMCGGRIFADSQNEAASKAEKTVKKEEG